MGASSSSGISSLRHSFFFCSFLSGFLGSIAPSFTCSWPIHRSCCIASPAFHDVAERKVNHAAKLTSRPSKPDNPPPHGAVNCTCYFFFASSLFSAARTYRLNSSHPSPHAAMAGGRRKDQAAAAASGRPRLTLAQISAYDDMCTDALVDHVSCRPAGGRTHEDGRP